MWILAYIVLIGVAGNFLRAHSNSGADHGIGHAGLRAFLFSAKFDGASVLGTGGGVVFAFWSLAVEEQFYLVSPLVVRLLSTRPLTIFLGCVIAAAPLLRVALLAAHTDPCLVSVLMPCRADSLAIGMLAAVFWRREGFRK